MSKITDPNRPYKPRTKDEMHDALKRFCNAAWGNHGANNRSCFSIPVDDEDADVILSDAIDELLAARGRIADLEETLQADKAWDEEHIGDNLFT